MRALLDTQIFLLMASAPEALSPAARQIVEVDDNEIYLSTVVVWEISIKSALGKLRLPRPPAIFIPDSIRRLRLLPMPITLSHALAVGDLPRHHRDPFDRMLVAQARKEGLKLLTADKQLAAYDVDIVAA